MQVILLFLHAHIYHIYKSNPFCTLYHRDCVSNYISRKMSVSHDIIMIEHNSKLPIRVLFCCFLCSLLNRFRLSHACRTRFLFFAQFSQWLSSTFHSFSTQITIGRRVNSVHTSSVLQVQQLHTADIPSEAYLLPIPKEHKLCSLPN